MQVPPRVDAIPIKAALSALEALLDEAGLDTERPDASAVWAAFTAFVARPVAGGNLHLEDDMCVFQWGVGTYDSAAGERFQWNLTRQFVLNDRDGEYDHMEQLSLTLFFDSDDPDLVGLGSGDVWSGGGLDRWLEEVVDLQAFRAVREKSPRGLRVEQYEV